MLGWVGFAAVEVVLIRFATPRGVDVAQFLIVSILVTAVIATAIAVEVFRPPVMRRRARSQPTPRGHVQEDALGRPVEIPADPALLRAEVTVQVRDGVRTFTTAGR